MKKGLIYVVLLLASISIASADFDVGNLSHSLQKEYGINQEIKGWINISFDDEPISSLFKDDKDHSISIESLLNKSQNSDFEYECNTLDCLSDYDANSESASKTFTLNSNQTKIVGFKITGEITEISEIKFEIESDVTSSCTSPVKIKLFDNEDMILSNNKDSNDSCANKKSYGCFNTNSPVESREITTTPYCQKINLSESPAFKLGAWVTEEISGTKKLIMSLYDGEEKVASCELVKPNSPGEVYCEVKYPVYETKSYYVCINANSNSATGKYKTKANTNPTTKCGFYNEPEDTATAAYQIFAEGKKYGALGNITVNNTFFKNIELGKAAENYVYDKYGDLDCSDECIIPIKITSNQNQQFTIKRLYVGYVKDSGPTSGYVDIFNLEETPAKITSAFQKLYIDQGGFLSSSSLGNFTFKLYIDDRQLISEKLIVGKVPVISSLTPLTAAAGFLTEFKVVVNSSSNITKYKWDFGDGSTAKDTTTGKISYAYNEENTYELTVSVTDKNQKTSSRTFSVVVGDPSKEINKTINQKLSYISNFKSQISTLDVSTKERLNTLFGIDKSETELKSIKADFENEEDYSTIISRLNEIRVPESIRVGMTLSDLSFFPDDKVIDPYVVNEFVSGNYSSDLFEDYINAIVAWNLADITSKVTMTEFTIKIDGQEKTLRVFELDIVNSGSDDGYLFIKDMEDLNFGGNYSQEQVSEFTVIRLSGDDNIIFSTTDEVDFTELPAFISPELDSLDVKEHNPTPTLNFFDWKLYALIIGILIVGWMIIYTILYNWYKRKYEVHLFSNRNNLLNLVTYINNEKRRGIPDNEIEKSLKKSKWSSEQITYAMRKYAGKRTGMLELPFFRIFSKKSKENITLKEYRGFRNDMFNQRAFIF